ncbi:MAG: hypothetical protein LC754_10530 [Acidobacteria bacterium]|nr:hypothetical protein [Acidobacteriota bacterium]
MSAKQKSVRIKVHDAYMCPRCEWITTEEIVDEPFFECSCGASFNWWTSPYRGPKCWCGKVAKRTHPASCPACNQGIDGFKPVEVIMLSGDLVPVQEVVDLEILPPDDPKIDVGMTGADDL